MYICRAPLAPRCRPARRGGAVPSGAAPPTLPSFVFLSPLFLAPFLLLLKAALFFKYLYLFCSVIRKESPGRRSFLPAEVTLGRPRVPACVTCSEGPGPCLPACPPVPILFPRSQELEVVFRPAAQLYSTGGGGWGWPGLPRCYFSMHQIVFMTPGEIYLILTFKRSGRNQKVMHSVCSRKKKLRGGFGLNLLAWGLVKKMYLF